jgi:osmotically-inducible protein OsmY
MSNFADRSTVASSDTNASLRNQGNNPGSPVRVLLAGVAIGATLTYLFDPSGGARRRAVLRDQAASLLRSTGRALNARARDTQNRLRGVVAETRTRFGDEVVEDDQLAARVRAELGHHVERVRPIEVTAEGGRVILRGEAPENDIDTVVATARKVRGVSEVQNDLRPLQT